MVHGLDSILGAVKNQLLVWFKQYAKGPGADPGFLERGLICIMMWGHFVDIISFVLHNL